MSKPSDFGSFFKENKDLAEEYLEARLEILRLQTIRTSSKIIGSVIWFIIFIFLIFLLFIFFGLVLGFWFTSLTNSLTIGFSISTGILLLLMILLTIFRHTLFVNPVIRFMIRAFTSDQEPDEESQSV
jgi:hypothetical protein